VSTPVTIVVGGPLSVATASVPSNEVGGAYHFTLAASGGVAPYSWSSTALPAGVVLSSTGNLTGAPAATCSACPVTFTVTDAASVTATLSTTITIGASLSLSGSYASGTHGVAYGPSGPTVSGGGGTISYAISGGAQPPGLALNPTTGALSGIPTTPGAYLFYLQVTDTNGGSLVVPNTVAIL
jgi:large repetitive protein